MMACPICEKQTDPAYRPFCSRRCADVDLGKWFNESYRVPVAEAEEPDREDAEGRAGERLH